MILLSYVKSVMKECHCCKGESRSTQQMYHYWVSRYQLTPISLLLLIV